MASDLAYDAFMALPDVAHERLVDLGEHLRVGSSCVGSICACAEGSRMRRSICTRI